ncbi:MAG: DUF4199 domain-containing protein [Gemmatimonadota bacterium]
MKKIVLTFGLFSGAVLSAMMVATLPFIDRIGFDKSQLIGYTTIVLAFLFVFFGVRAYRDNVGAGAVSFVRAFGVGVLIAAIASVCYVATWQLLYYKFLPDFGEKYAAHVIEKERASGASEQAIAVKTAEVEKFQELYKNPLINASITFLEPFSVGLIIALLSAGILRRKQQPHPD